MSREQFENAPWKTQHRAYEGSVIAMKPAPEFSTAEVILASAYRTLGYSSHQESLVPSAGRAFDKASAKPRRKSDDRISAETWKTILHGALQSPKQPKQSSKRFLSLCPIVPDASLYSGSARLSGNPWNPGQLLLKLIATGCESPEEFDAIWKLLFDGLSVTDDDDIWARWLQKEFEARRTISSVTWSRSTPDITPSFSAQDHARVNVPARQFVQDLRAVIEAKGSMTRRQWMSILEAVVRLGCVAHVLWVCVVHDRLWKLIRAVMSGAELPSRDLFASSVFSGAGRPLAYGATALPLIRDLASRYLHARLGINLLLWELESQATPVRSLEAISSLHELLTVVGSKKDAIQASGFADRYSELCDTSSRELSCKKGIGNNLVEFCRYALGQRQTADATLRGYDQGYQLRKKAEYASAPWVVSLGPVALLAFTHCCLLEAKSPRSVLRLCEHLGRYGIDIDRDDIAQSELGMKLRMLGLVLDSPDAESGMLLVPPFEPARVNA